MILMLQRNAEFHLNIAKKNTPPGMAYSIILKPLEVNWIGYQISYYLHDNGAIFIIQEKVNRFKEILLTLEQPTLELKVRQGVTYGKGLTMQ